MKRMFGEEMVGVAMVIMLAVMGGGAHGYRDGEFVCKEADGTHLGSIVSDASLEMVWEEGAFEFPNPRGAFPEYYNVENTKLDAPTVVVTLCNAPYVDLAVANVAVMVAAGVMRDPDSPAGDNDAHIQRLVIVSLDDETCRVLEGATEKHGISDLVICLPSIIKPVDGFHPPTLAEGGGVSDEYIAIMQGKSQTVRDFIRCGMNVLSLDMDAFIVNPNFAAYLAGPGHRGAHLVVQTEGPLPAGDQALLAGAGHYLWPNVIDDLCAGFAFFTTSRLTLDALDVVIQVEAKNRMVDQETLTFVIQQRARTFLDRPVPTLQDDTASMAAMQSLQDRGLFMSFLPNQFFLPGYANPLPSLYATSPNHPGVPLSHPDSQFMILHFAGGCYVQTSEIACKLQNVASSFHPHVDQLFLKHPIYRSAFLDTLQPDDSQ